MVKRGLGISTARQSLESIKNEHANTGIH